MDVFTKYEQFSLLALIIEAQFMNFYMKTRKSQKQSFIQEGFFFIVSTVTPLMNDSANKKDHSEHFSKEIYINFSRDWSGEVVVVGSSASVIYSSCTQNIKCKFVV